ncbi:MAG TPA: DUF5689 domain-containing protein [Bacteroidales bacterium]|nr:DUF5689 domain-containing protein [Bacteroidales bacterium]
MKQLVLTISRKWMLLSMLVGLLGIWSCDNVSDLPEKPTLETDTEFLVFGLEGGSKTIEFNVNREWTAKLLNKNDSTWCTLSTVSGKAGNKKITVTVTALDGDFRQAILILNSSAAGKEIPIMQSGKPIVMTADAIDIDEANATLTGSWYYSGEIEVTHVGFSVAPASTGTYQDYNLVRDSIVQGNFAGIISSLSSETNYLYKAYVKTSTGETYYGEEKTFKTDAIPVHLAVKDLVARGKALSVGGSLTLTQSEYIDVVVSNVVESANTITLSLVDANCSADVAANKSVANYGITSTIPSNVSTLGVYKVGDVLTIRTKGSLLSNTNGNPLLAIQDVKYIKTNSTGQTLIPVTVAHTNLSNYLAMYVAVENTQVTKAYQNSTTYPSWGNTVFTMEVLDSEESYLMQLPSTSTFAGDAVRTGSGTLKGIVAPGLIGYLLSPRVASDVAGLTNTRFASMLELRFLSPVFNGVLTLGEASTCYISIPYRNGDNSTINASITVSASGDASTGLSFATLNNPTIGGGTGSLVLAVTGTPSVEGLISFTINGFDTYLTTNTVTATVVKPELPVIGNFEATWDVSTSNYATTIPFKTNTNPAITASSLVATNFNGSSTTTKWTTDLGTTGCDANTAANKLTAPSRYVTFSLKVSAGKILHLSGLDLVCRTNGGDSEVSVQYSLDGTTFTEINNKVEASGVADTINIGKFPALKTVVEGSTVTFRIVPVNTNAVAKWGIKGGTNTRGLAIYGDVSDK